MSLRSVRDRPKGAELLTILRRLSPLENEQHRVRDVTFSEDASRVRTGHGPAMMAVHRNLTISLVRLANTLNVAA